MARHLGRDRKTIRAYLSGERTPGSGGRHRTPSCRSCPIAANDSRMTPTCGPPRCSTR
ncbi:hypothetical protein [Streptomyces bluensis]|uniref:hypothetical protein n=1 Tax=Streptomyces bluensis TaxID=33897 RepID=UPI003570EA2B